MHYLLTSFILDIYVAPLKESYSEVLSVKIQPKRIDLRNL